MENLNEIKEWYEKVYGVGNVKVYYSRGELCVDIINPKAVAIGSVLSHEEFKKLKGNKYSICAEA